MHKIYSKDDLLFDVEVYDDDMCYDIISWDLIKEFTVKIWTTDESVALVYTLPDLISYRLPIPSSELSKLQTGILKASYSVGVASLYFADGMYNRSGEINTEIYLINEKEA
jgi:hypothetical protein